MLALIYNLLLTLQTAVTTAGTNVSTILTNIGTVLTNLNTANTNISSTLTKVNGVADWSKASVQKYNSVTTTVLTVNTYQTILSVSGKGYLKKAVIKSLSSSCTGTIRITVDGVVTVILASSGSAATGGFIIEDLILTNGTNLCVFIIGAPPMLTSLATIVPYPDTSAGIKVAISPQPIYFNTSLLIEIQSQYSGYNHQVDYSYCAM